ncbi:unnamed protein product [Mytilus edulis]|uniref:Sushi domain-containing protein n=1 Tax=Mytilus edulis TaxID=6550 RepID=A0A8S3UGK9_MYTED|nr:unnamed protein product [Mytilus edulis]
MIFKYYKLTLVLAALIVQAIQITCNDPQIRNCGNASIYIDVGDNTVGAEAHLSCSNGYTLWGNDSIVCLDSGQWSQQNAYYFLWIGLESINGGNYSWPSGNTTQTNQYENWFDNVPQSVIDNPAAGSCVQAFPFYDFWLPNPKNLCDTKLDDFVCELR